MTTEETRPNQQEQVRHLLEMDARRLKLQTTGAWYSCKDGKGVNHFYMQARDDTEMVVSMCATVVTTVDILHAPLPGANCLVCSLYEDAGGGDLYEERMKRRLEHARRVMDLNERRITKLNVSQKSLLEE